MSDKLQMLVHRPSGTQVSLAHIEKILAEAEREMGVPRKILETAPTIRTARETAEIQYAILRRKYDAYRAEKRYREQ